MERWRRASPSATWALAGPDAGRPVKGQGSPQPQVHAEAVRNYLTHLAVYRRVSASTQNQAMCAILFLCRDVLGLNPEGLSLTPRARRGPRACPSS